MDLNEMKNIWNQQQESSTGQFSPSELMQKVDRKVDSLKQDTHRRDRREIIAGVLLIIIFGYVLVASSNLLTQIGSAIIMLASGYIIYRLKSEQMQDMGDSTPADLPVRKHLLYEMEQVRQQSKMVKTVAWWYIMPLTVGLVFITMGGESSLGVKLGYMLFVLLVGAGIWKYNQRAVAQKYEPLIDELQEAIEVVEDNQG